MNQNRPLTYAFRLTERERRSIEAGAKRARQPLGNFVREAALEAAQRNRKARNGQRAAGVHRELPQNALEPGADSTLRPAH